MEASPTLRNGFTMYRFDGPGEPDLTHWPEAPLRDEDETQLYYFDGDQVPGAENGAQVPGWKVVGVSASAPQADAAQPTAGSGDNAAADGAAQPTGTQPSSGETTAPDATPTDTAPTAGETPATPEAGASPDQPAPVGTAQPDPSHAPAAAKEEETIVADAGLGEQQPVEPGHSQDTPAIGSTPPQAQSGVPLPEDRAAGVQPDPTVAGTVAPSGASMGDPAVATETPAQPTADEKDEAAIDAEREALTEEEAALKEREAAEAASGQGGAETTPAS